MGPSRTAVVNVFKYESESTGWHQNWLFCRRRVKTGSGAYLVLVTTCPARDPRRRSAEADKPDIGQASPLIVDIYLRNMGGKCPRSADRALYRRLNDAVCVCVGEVRAPGDPGQAGPDLVIDVAELIWEPITD